MITQRIRKAPTPVGQVHAKVGAVGVLSCLPPRGVQGPPEASLQLRQLGDDRALVQQLPAVEGRRHQARCLVDIPRQAADAMVQQLILQGSEPGVRSFSVSSLAMDLAHKRMVHRWLWHMVAPEATGTVAPRHIHASGNKLIYTKVLEGPQVNNRMMLGNTSRCAAGMHICSKPLRSS